MVDAPGMLQSPQSECPEISIRLPRHKWPKSWLEDPVVLLERNVYGHPVAGFLWERQFEEVLLGLRWEKGTELGMSFFCSQEIQGLFLSVHVDDINLAARKQNMGLMWKKLMELVVFDELTSFLDHVYLGCTQRVPQLKITRMGSNLTPKLWRGPTTWKDMRRSA